MDLGSIRDVFPNMGERRGKCCGRNSNADIEVHERYLGSQLIVISARRCLLTYRIQKESSELLRLYEARAAIDALDEAIVEAKKRQVEEDNGNHKDEWKPDIDPRTAVRARVMPVLEKEQAELQKELDELEEQNRKYIARIQRNRAEYRAIDQEIKSRLNTVEQVYKIINTMDNEELQQWMLAADEAGTTTAD
ncbi:Nnf1, partial [Rhizoctonia solani]